MNYKFWTIGTNVMKYVDYWSTWASRGVNSINIRHISNDRTSVYVILNNSEEEKFKKSTISQILRCLLSLGLITSNMPLKYDKSVISEYPTYSLQTLNSAENLGDFLSISLRNTVERALDEKHFNPLYPSETSFIFTLLSTVIYSFDKTTKKLIERKSIGGTFDSAKKYFEELAREILSSNEGKNLIEYSRKYVVGFSSNLKRVIESINETPATNTTPIFAPRNLEHQITSKPVTLGGFVTNYFTTNSKILIPLYQRKYIWPESTVLTLLGDIRNINIENSTHFIGDIIVQSEDIKGTRYYKVIDGQQRITTLILLLRAMFDYSKFNKYPVDYSLNDKFLVESDASIYSSFKRVEGNEDFDSFKEIITGDAFKSKSKIKSQMFTNYSRALEWIDETVNSSDDMYKLWKQVLNCVTFIVIDDKTSNEYKLFEKLNTGKIPLTTLELFKNYILDAFKDAELSEKNAQKMFEENIASKFNKKTIKKDIENFITAYLRKTNSSTTNETLFNQFKDSIYNDFIQSNPGISLEEILNSISSEIDTFNLIKNYDEYTDKKTWVHDYADFLYMLDGRLVYMPLIMRIFEYHHVNGDVNAINYARRYLKVIEIFEVRMQVAKYRGQSLSQKIEKILNEFNSDTSPEEFWWMFKDDESSSTGMASIDLFKETLEKQPIANKPAKLIMTRIENYFSLPNKWDISKDQTFVALFKQKSQREHLMPNAWREYWKKHLEFVTGKSEELLELSVQKTIGLIGNAFPIPNWSNNEIKNKALEYKLKNVKDKTYSRISVLLNGNDEFPQITDSFGPDEIMQRSKNIAEIASKIWKDFE